jgi:hypothetical protein
MSCDKLIAWIEQRSPGEFVTAFVTAAMASRRPASKTLLSITGWSSTLD